MSDDLLRRAARALREREGGDEPAGRATKADVLRALAPPARGLPSRRARPLVFALAAALAVPTAWAAAAGRLPALRHAIAVALGEPTAPTLTPEAPEPPPGPKAPPRREARAAGDAAPPEDAASAAAAPSAHDQGPYDPPLPGRGEWLPSAPKREPAPRPPASTRPAPKAPPSEPAARPAEAAPTATAAPAVAAAPSADELYEQAHRAHFAGRDPAAALAAWDRYLAAAPRGRFALEARYNRALSLSRLGRRDEAARALEPFAAGDFGGYRQSEAQKLLRSLRGDRTPD